ncbi:MAG: hypothetical protein XXXJIFNMEKO3_01666 [Candidatus Erwinia impunctatus]|nr:hypothetical protein XXXJIFNMEKO_01666 [Culicoides impunctatus]
MPGRKRGIAGICHNRGYCVTENRQEKKDIRIVPFESAFSTQAAALSKKVGWPHREEDWLAALQLGAGIAALADDKLVGTALYWRWGQNYASLGLVIVDPAWQGRGIGHQLVGSIVTLLSDCTIRLSATSAGQTLYEKHGFVAQGHMQQWQCLSLPRVQSPELSEKQVLREASHDDLLRLTQLDFSAHGQYRPRLLSSLLQGEPRVIVLEEQRKVQAYAVMRRFGLGQMIGPVVSQTLSQAQQLMAYLMATQQGCFVRSDIVEETGLGVWMQESGLQQRDRTAIMVRGSGWQATGMRNIAVMSQAMG